MSISIAPLQGDYSEELRCAHRTLLSLSKSPMAVLDIYVHGTYLFRSVLSIKCTASKRLYIKGDKCALTISCIQLAEMGRRYFNTLV